MRRTQAQLREEESLYSVREDGWRWHGVKKCNCGEEKQEAADYLNKKKRMYAHEIWAHDERKRITAESAGYRVIAVWDSEYKKNKNSINELIHAIEN